MLYLLLIFSEILLLKFLVGRVNRHVMSKLHFWLYSVVFFPGTLLHEMSHFIMAKLLLVPVGSLSLIPEKSEHEIVLGSVSIAKVDIFRRLTIGFAPILFGVVSIYGLIALIVAYRLHSNIFIFAATGYVLFVITNSMYSSREDLRGYWKVLLPLILVVSAVFLAGIRLEIIIPDYGFLRDLSLYLLIPIVINGIMLLFLNRRRTSL